MGTLGGVEKYRMCVTTSNPTSVEGMQRSAKSSFMGGMRPNRDCREQQHYGLFLAERSNGLSDWQLLAQHALPSPLCRPASPQRVCVLQSSPLPAFGVDASHSSTAWGWEKGRNLQTHLTSRSGPDKSWSEECGLKCKVKWGANIYFFENFFSFCVSFLITSKLKQERRVLFIESLNFWPQHLQVYRRMFIRKHK